MKRYFLLLLSVFFLYSCSDEIPEEQLPVRAGRTVFAYLISNNGGGSLDSNLKQNLVDMYAGLASVKDTCTLLVYYRPYASDDDGLEGPSILKFISDGNGYINRKPALTGNELTPKNVIKASIITSYKEEENHRAVDMNTMKRMLEDMKKLAPSESYGLIFGSHGTGWMKGNTLQGRAFGDDGGYSINIPEMADVLGEVFQKPLDFILFDACMMATAEVCYELKGVTNYLIGSVVETHVYGNPYNVMIPELFEEEIDYAGLCKDYIEFSMDKGAWGVSAAIDCSKMDELTGWVKANIGNYSEELSTLDLAEVQQYGVYRSSLNSNYEYFSFDIVDLFTELNEGTVPEELEDIMSKVVIAKDALYGDSYRVVGSLLIEEGHYCGLGMYLPKNSQINRTDWDTYYESSISWYKAAGWEDYFMN